tara:strand:+ start:418 stop:579 length:162 start_codon:yes stop_codon:yes gene_type:complete
MVSESSMRKEFIKIHYQRHPSRLTSPSRKKKKQMKRGKERKKEKKQTVSVKGS